MAAPTPGPMQGLTTDPLYFDVECRRRHVHAPGESAATTFFCTSMKAASIIGPAGNARALKPQRGVLSAGDRIEVRATAEGARFSCSPDARWASLVVQYGPFSDEHARGDRAGGTRLPERTACSMTVGA